MASRVFTVPEFDRFARKARISDDQLLEAVDRADRGLIYADLRQDVIKQAIGRPNESARHGFRTIVGYRRGARAVFFAGFAKNQAETITRAALENYRELAEMFLGVGDTGIGELLDLAEIRVIERPSGQAKDRLV